MRNIGVAIGIGIGIGIGSKLKSIESDPDTDPESLRGVPRTPWQSDLKGRCEGKARGNLIIKQIASS